MINIIRSSFLYKDSVVLNTTLHTNLKGVNPSDIKLKIGNISITKNKIKSISNITIPFELLLDKWTLKINNWSLDGLLTANSGVLKTQMVDIPLNSLILKPKELVNFDLNLKSILLAGFAQVKATGQTSFGYNPAKNNWYLSVVSNNNPAASFGGLPGMDAKDSIYISSFSLNSDGSKTFSSKPKTVKIFKVGLLSLDEIKVGDNSIEMSSLNFNIPQVGQLGALVQYIKENNQIKFKFLPVPIKINSNGIEVTFGTNYSQPSILDEYGLRVRGIISENDNFSFKAWLYHSIDSTTILVENPNISTPQNFPQSEKKWQTFVLGPSTYFDKITGRMKVISNSWQNFQFSGYLISKGIESNKNKLSFDVYGDIVANNQELGVKNINSPFGNISFTYEPQNKRFFGSLSMNKDLGYAYIKGTAEAVIDNEGWYFFCGGEMEVYNPNSKGSAGLMIGNHSVTEQIKYAFQQYSYVYKIRGSMPLTFPTNLKVFLWKG